MKIGDKIIVNGNIVSVFGPQQVGWTGRITKIEDDKIWGAMDQDPDAENGDRWYDPQWVDCFPKPIIEPDDRAYYEAVTGAIKYET